MATPFKFDTRKHGNINDSGIRDLPLGKHNFKIIKVSYDRVKSDKSGKRSHVVIELQHSSGSKYTKFLEIFPKSNEANEETRARISAEEFNAYVQAAGFTGVLTVPKFKVLAGKLIGIETVKEVNKASKKEYINTVQIVKGGFSVDELTTLVEEETEEEEAEEPAKKKPRKKAKAKPPVEEEEEEDDFEDDDEDYGDDDPFGDDEDEDEDDEDPFA